MPSARARAAADERRTRQTKRTPRREATMGEPGGVASGEARAPTPYQRSDRKGASPKKTPHHHEWNNKYSICRHHQHQKKRFTQPQTQGAAIPAIYVPTFQIRVVCAAIMANSVRSQRASVASPIRIRYHQGNMKTALILVALSPASVLCAASRRAKRAYLFFRSLRINDPH